MAASAATDRTCNGLTGFMTTSLAIRLMGCYASPTVSDRRDVPLTDQLCVTHAACSGVRAPAMEVAQPYQRSRRGLWREGRRSCGGQTPPVKLWAKSNT